MAGERMACRRHGEIIERSVLPRDKHSPMPITLDTRLAPNPDVIVTELPGSDGGTEAVLLNLATYKYFNLNGSGLRIWKLIEQQQPLSAAANDLMAHFDVEREQADAAVLRLAAELSAAELVIRRDASAGGGCY
jgi:hypothetical protein